MTDEDLERKARELATQLRAEASPSEIFKFARKYKKEGREPIKEEADSRLPSDLDNREEMVEEVTDIVIEGLEKLPI